MNEFESLIGELAQLPWDGFAPEVHLRVEEILARQWENRPQLMRALGAHIKGMELPPITRTAELHSWLLHNEGEWLVKLNQFFPSPSVGKRSENVHDHTRFLTSLTLTGGYQQRYFDHQVLRRDYKLGDRFRQEDLPSRPGPSTRPGLVYTMDTNVFHAITGFEDGTLTLCVYGKIAREEIRVFNCVSGYVERRITYRSAQATMLHQLRGLEEGSDQ